MSKFGMGALRQADGRIAIAKAGLDRSDKLSGIKQAPNVSFGKMGIGHSVSGLTQPLRVQSHFTEGIPQKYSQLTRRGEGTQNRTHLLSPASGETVDLGLQQEPLFKL